MNPHRCLTLSAAAFGVLGGLTATLARHLPSGQDLSVILTSPQIEVETRYLRPGARREYARHVVCRCGPRLDADQIPSLLKEALLAQEDTRFYIHHGIDWIGLGRALASMASGGAVQGGSTLTEQLVKNLITGNARTGLEGVMRKLREAFIARRVESVMTKDEILAAYLNEVSFGSRTFGIVQAARRYFGKPVKDLDLYEAAMLVGMLQGPSRYNPITSPAAADRQARAVLKKMLDQRRIGRDDYFRALRQAYAMPTGKPVAPVDVAPGYYLAWARTELADLAASHPSARTMRYVIGLDPWLQALGSATIREAIARSSNLHVGQGALVAIDADGRVVALVGGADFATSQFDHATEAKRQPGSAFKLFVYAAAMNAGLGPGSIRLDEPIPKGYSPDDDDHRFLGPVPLITAFAKSRNTVAVRLFAEVGADAVVSIAHELGIRSSLRRDPTLALGTSEVTLLELTSAYAPFMTDGRPVRPYAVRIALNARGEVVWRRKPARLRPVVSAAAFRSMRTLLRAVVTEGTGREARLRDRWSAGKTGTTQKDRDAWFVGFTDRLTTGVWFGNDSGPMTGVWGGSLPAQAWRAFNEAVTAQPFPESATAVADGRKAAHGARRRPWIFDRAASHDGGLRSN